MLSIVISIASVIAMLSIGQSAKQQIEANIRSIGSNLLLVCPEPCGFGGSSAPDADRTNALNDDVAAIRKEVTNVTAVAQSYATIPIIRTWKNTNTQVVGTSSAYMGSRNVSLENGSFFPYTGHISIQSDCPRADRPRHLFGAGSDRSANGYV